jgi:hypothetical protein
LIESARVTRTVLMRSSNHYPLGNCDSFRLETGLNYLTRLGTVSYRSLSLSPFFALLTRANVSEELVNIASAVPTQVSGFKRGRANQPDPAFPQSPGIILETNISNLSIVTARSVLSMNY